MEGERERNPKRMFPCKNHFFVFNLYFSLKLFFLVLPLWKNEKKSPEEKIFFLFFLFFSLSYQFFFFCFCFHFIDGLKKKKKRYRRHRMILINLDRFKKENPFLLFDVSTTELCVFLPMCSGGH